MLPNYRKVETLEMLFNGYKQILLAKNEKHQFQNYTEEKKLDVLSTEIMNELSKENVNVQNSGTSTTNSPEEIPF